MMAASRSSRNMREKVVVCVPMPREAEISPTRATSSITSAFTVFDLPMPLWPTRSVILPSSSGRSAAVSNLADIEITV